MCEQDYGFCFVQLVSSMECVTSYKLEWVFKMLVYTINKDVLSGLGFCLRLNDFKFWQLIKVSCFICLSGVLFGCASNSTQPDSSLSTISKNSNKTLNALTQQYGSWKSVKYQLGGLSKRGVDCSGFVYLTFQDKLGVKIPRTTKLQYASSKKINKKELRTGDLVFFKTGLKQKHVGIYMSQMKFLHASTSKGVTVSNMNNPYWKKHFLSARRI